MSNDKGRTTCFCTPCSNQVRLIGSCAPRTHEYILRPKYLWVVTTSCLSLNPDYKAFAIFRINFWTFLQIHLQAPPLSLEKYKKVKGKQTRPSLWNMETRKSSIFITNCSSTSSLYQSLGKAEEKQAAVSSPHLLHPSKQFLDILARRYWHL